MTLLRDRLNWQTLVFHPEERPIYRLCVDDFELCSVWKMPADSQWRAGLWMLESYIDIDSADELQPMLDMAEDQAAWLIEDKEMCEIMRDAGVQM